MIIYGSMQCPDCVECCRQLDGAHTVYEFRDISENLLYLKEFLRIRDTEPVFAEVKHEGKIGIPCILHSDGTVSFSWN